MDPVAAVGVAAAAVQFFSFSAQTLKLCVEIRDSGGGTLDNLQLEKRCKELNDITNGLTESSSVTQAPPCRSTLRHDEALRLRQQLDISDRRLREFGQRCLVKAKELLQLLQDLKAKCRSPLHVLAKALSTMRSQKRIEKLENGILKLQNDYAFANLHHLKSHLDLNTMEFADLRSTLDSVSTSIQTISVQQMEATNGQHVQARHIQHELVGVRKHVSTEVSNLKASAEDDDRLQRLLDSLSFPDMKTRREHIRPEWKGTFQWIFDDPAQHESQWTDYAHWLRSESGIYWIHGKPGSGKSTLMSFLVDHEETRHHLKSWCGQDSRLQMPSFFFWKPGSELQQSILGLLRSLLFQLCETDLRCANVLIDRAGPRSAIAPWTWTERTLRKALSDALKATTDKICFFIDGLDEFTGPADELMSLVAQVGKAGAIKFCMSSRPEALLEATLGRCAQLRLQDLTYRDIHRYVSGKLDHLHHLRSLVKKVVQRADGIFLWAALVTQSILEGAEAGDQSDTLQARLDQTPRQLDDLYNQLLCNIDNLHKASVAFYFQLVRCGSPKEQSLWLGAITAAVYPGAFTSIESGLKQFRHVEKYLNIRSKGLICVSSGIESYREMNFDLRKAARSREKSLAESRNINREQRHRLETEIHYLRHEQQSVQFLHRTVSDFVFESPAGRAFLDGHGKSQQDIEMALLDSMASWFRSGLLLQGTMQYRLRAVIDFVRSRFGDVESVAWSYLDAVYETLTASTVPGIFDDLSCGSAYLNKHLQYHKDTSEFYFLSRCIWSAMPVYVHSRLQQSPIHPQREYLLAMLISIWAGPITDIFSNTYNTYDLEESSADLWALMAWLFDQLFQNSPKDIPSGSDTRVCIEHQMSPVTRFWWIPQSCLGLDCCQEATVVALVHAFQISIDLYLDGRKSKVCGLLMDRFNQVFELLELYIEMWSQSAHEGRHRLCFSFPVSDMTKRTGTFQLRCEVLPSHAGPPNASKNLLLISHVLSPQPADTFWKSLCSQPVVHSDFRLLGESVAEFNKIQELLLADVKSDTSLDSSQRLFLQASIRCHFRKLWIILPHFPDDSSDGSSTDEVAS